MLIQFYPCGEANEPPIRFTGLWQAINHVEAHQETGIIDLTYRQGDMLAHESLHYEAGKLLRDEG